MKFEAFQQAAEEAYEEIPGHFKEGIDGLVVSRDAVPHPERADVYTLGECLTEDHVSDYGSPDTTRSIIALYWGSFRQLAKRGEGFDWEGEIWETLTHELRHHLESLAGDDALEGVDYAAEQTFRRDEGLDFDPWYFEQGERVADGVYEVEGSVYIEQLWSSGDFEQAATVDFEWDGAAYQIDRPEELGDVHFVWLEGVQAEVGSLELVLVRKRSWWEDAKRMIGAYRPHVLESTATARPGAG